MKQTFLICCLLLMGASFNQANAQLHCHNKTDKPVWIAIGYNFIPDLESKDTWVTEGWIYAGPDEKVTLSSHMGYDAVEGIKTNFFYYAYQVGQGGREWTGIRKFVVDTNKPSSKEDLEFSIRRAHKQGVHDNPKYERRLFKAGVLGVAGEDGSNEHTIILRQSDKNDRPEKSAGRSTSVKAPNNPTTQPSTPPSDYKPGGFRRGGYKLDGGGF